MKIAFVVVVFWNVNSFSETHSLIISLARVEAISSVINFHNCCTACSFTERRVRKPKHA